MANIKDPAFWHRFSIAVHQEEHAMTSPSPSKGTSSPTSVSSRPPLKPGDSWLDRQHKKRKRARVICVLVLVLVLLVAGGAAFGIWYLVQHGGKIFPNILPDNDKSQQDSTGS